LAIRRRDHAHYSLDEIMKNILLSFMMMWFMFRASNESNVTKFLNLLPQGSDIRIIARPPDWSTFGITEWLVFYTADKEIKLK
jgi:hypothetical protein